MIINFNNSVLAVLPKVDYRVRLLTFLYLSMWFCAFAVFEYALVNMLFRIEARVEKARDKAEAECGIEQCINQREREREYCIYQMFAASPPTDEHTLHAIDATPARRRGGVGVSPRQGLVIQPITG